MLNVEIFCYMLDVEKYNCYFIYMLDIEC